MHLVHDFAHRDMVSGFTAFRAVRLPYLYLDYIIVYVYTYINIHNPQIYVHIFVNFVCVHILKFVLYLEHTRKGVFIFIAPNEKEVICMTLTEAQKKANTKYREKSIKRIPLDVKKEKYEEIKSAADRSGESVNGYIKKAIDERMERES